jgi:hypothetical protein
MSNKEFTKQCLPWIRQVNLRNAQIEPFEG